MAAVIRYDSGKLDKVQRMPGGGIRVQARMSRVGVLEYKQPDGSVRREFRPESEVFNQDSIESLKAIPVTIGHPGKMNPDIWRDNAVGHTGDDVHREDGFIAGSVVLHDADAIKAVEGRALQECSMAYTLEVDETPGEYEGQRYDGVQKNIRGNHLALGPEGWGRAGREVRLRMDGNEETPTSPKLDVMTPEEIAKLQVRADSAEAKVVTLEAENKTLKSSHETLTAKVDMLAAKLDANTKEQATRADSAVQERLDLIDSTREILGSDFDYKKKSTKDIKSAVVVKVSPGMRLDGKSDEYLNAAFDMAMAKPAEPHESLGRLNQDSHSVGVHEDPIGKAEKANREASQNAWKTTNRDKLLGGAR